MEDLTQIAYEKQLEDKVQKIKESITETIPKILDYHILKKELISFGLKLDEDPTSKGLKNFNIKIAQIDAQKTRAMIILTTAISNENMIDKLYKRVLSFHDITRANFLAFPDVSKLPNQSARDAEVIKKMNDLIEVKDNADTMLQNAKTFTKVARNVVDMLESTNKNISRQLSVVQSMLATGELQTRAV